MKIDTMTAVALGFAAFAAYTLTKKPATATTRAGTNGSDVAYGMSKSQRDIVGAATSNTSGWVNQIFNDDVEGQPGYGWQYFSNGTAISPEGVYYLHGAEVWRPQ